MLPQLKNSVPTRLVFKALKRYLITLHATDSEGKLASETGADLLSLRAL